MITRQMLSATLLAAVLTVGASAADAANTGTEKCYGVVKAGSNDCKTAAHACGSHATMDASATDFVVVPAGLCAKLVNGSTKPMMKKPMDGMNK